MNKKSDLKDRCFNFSLRIIEFINNLPNKKTFWVIGGQLLRAGTSIGANIIEAKSSSSKIEFIRYYEISLKSGNETIYWLELLKFSDLKIEKIDDLDFLLKEVKEICNILGASLLTMKGKRKV